MRVAFLTTDDLDGYQIDDDHVVVPAAALGIQIDFVPWKAPTRWQDYDAVVIRSVWDYQHDVDDFLACLEKIEALGIPLWNPSAVARWNMEKGYLAELGARGLPVVPSHFARLESEDQLRTLASRIGGPVVVKPRVGASGQDTWMLTPGEHPDRWAKAAGVLRDREIVLQPFLSRIMSEGELSLILIDGQSSHMIRKRPVGGEFRSQEEHGGEVVQADDAEFSAWALDFVSRVPEAKDLLYARIDAIRDDEGRWLLGELELIEPSLYLRFDPESPARLARALMNRLNRPSLTS